MLRRELENLAVGSRGLPTLAQIGQGHRQGVKNLHCPGTQPKRVLVSWYGLAGLAQILEGLAQCVPATDMVGIEFDDTTEELNGLLGLACALSHPVHNEERPHQSLDYRTPGRVYRQRVA